MNLAAKLRKRQVKKKRFKILMHSKKKKGQAYNHKKRGGVKIGTSSFSVLILAALVQLVVYAAFFAIWML